MLKEELKALIPTKFAIFNKLKSGDPYYFDRWDGDVHGNDCLYYWFYSKNKAKKNRKRVVISEIENLLKKARQLNVSILTGADFRECCPTTLSAGPCGRTVIIRLLEYLDIGNYLEGQGVQLTNNAKIQLLIEG